MIVTIHFGPPIRSPVRPGSLGAKLFNSFRSPETKHEVRQASNVLFTLTAIFIAIALSSLVWWIAYGGTDPLIIAFVLGGVSALLVSAGAYNRYYIRTMSHAPIVAAALRNPMVTVAVIIAAICLLTLGLASLLIYRS